MRSSVMSAILAGLLAIPAQSQEPSRQPIFKLQEVMIPMRDGVKLQTVILTPADQHEPLPILFRRTPYGVPERPPEQLPASWKELAQDGYIFVIQNLRGRFKSEGAFDLTSQVDLSISQVLCFATYRRGLIGVAPKRTWTAPNCAKHARCFCIADVHL